MTKRERREDALVAIGLVIGGLAVVVAGLINTQCAIAALVGMGLRAVWVTYRYLSAVRGASQSTASVTYATETAGKGDPAAVDGGAA